MRSIRYLLIALGLTSFASPIAAQDIVNLFRRVNPAVAVLHTIERGATRSGGQASFEGIGSGVLIAPTSIITAAHVVQTADVVEVEFVTGEKIYANVVASDPLSDLALLELESEPMDIRPVKLGNSDRAEVGSEVFIVGAPLGLSHSLTVGYISARRGNEASGDALGSDVEIFQTDAAINQGNSGGPMFNMDGEVIGIVSYILSQSGGFEGLGFAITSNTAERVLLEEGTFWSGLTAFPITGQLAGMLNIPEKTGFLVQKVALNSPAERAGLRPSTVPAVIAGRALLLGGDVILAVDGILASEPDARSKSLKRLRDLKGGESVKIDILRSGRREQLTYYEPRAR